jgi:CRP-like cAMP-binding protein
LSSLSRADLGLLKPQLQSVELPLRRRLESRNRRIRYVYFIEAGIASVVAHSAGQLSIEVGIIGREGMTGLAVVMGTDRSPHETFMQVAGSGLQITAVKLREGMAESASLQRAFLRYGHSFVTQTAHTALANGRSKIEERLARWLLMTHDRGDTDELYFTHEFLALMLGVRRSGVTVALNLLKNEGLIRTQRSAVWVIDRKGLEETANGSYGVPEAELRRLMS